MSDERVFVEAAAMTSSSVRPSSVHLPQPASVALELSLYETDRDLEDDDEEVDPDGQKRSGRGPLSDNTIGIREWGTSRVFPLRTPQDSRRAVASTTALQLSRGGSLANASNRIELTYESESWRVNDRHGIANLKQDGRPTHEARLAPGVEVTIAGRVFIAESARSIALRNFCSRLIGWDSARIAVVDHALRAIRLASAGYAPLVLRGVGDLVPVAHTLHRYAVGNHAPFVVSDPRRMNTLATVRAAANYRSGLEGFRRASGGTLCVRAGRPPVDFADVLASFRQPESGVWLVVCAPSSYADPRDAFAISAAQIDIPSLETRRLDLPRIVREYVEDAIDILHAPGNCMDARDIEWIIERSALANDIAIPDIEKAAFRVVAVKLTRDLSKAASLLGMARVSLERWLRRRHDERERAEEATP